MVMGHEGRVLQGPEEGDGLVREQHRVGRKMVAGYSANGQGRVRELLEGPEGWDGQATLMSSRTVASE
jgi:hypothetical protein